MKITKRTADVLRRILGTESIIVITDTEAYMNMKGKRPGTLNLFQIAMQRAHLSGYRDSLDRLIREHDTLLGMSDKPKKPAKKPVRKIKVKKG